VILYSQQDFEWLETKTPTDGKGLFMWSMTAWPETFEKGLNCCCVYVAEHGDVGTASGPVGR